MIIRIRVAISGGRTSAYMAWWLENNKPIVAAWLGSPGATIIYIFTFANTGMEHDDSLRFLHDVDQQLLGGAVIWLEAVVSPDKGDGTRHRVVNYATAFRNNQYNHTEHPYHAVTRKYGVSNRVWQPCTREMKRHTMESYTRSIGGVDFTAIGIRADENRRVSPSAGASNIIYPLVDLHPTDKQDVLAFWEDKPYDLRIPEWQGNCVTCFKKSDKKLNQVWIETPEVFEFTHMIETDYGWVGPEFAKGVDAPRVCFRKHRSTQDMIAFFKANEADPIRFIDKEDAGCSESCEVYETE